MVATIRNVLIAALALLIFAVLLVFVFWVALWLAIIAAVIVAIALLNLVFLPRLASRIRLSTTILVLLLLPLFVALGWLVARNSLGGALAGFVVWLGAFALPRLAFRSARTRASAKIEFHIGEGKKAASGAESRRGEIRVVKPPDL
jgi:hypothetical protein